MHRSELIKKIESITLQMISDMNDGVPLMLSHPHSSDWSQTELEADRLINFNWPLVQFAFLSESNFSQKE